MFRFPLFPNRFQWLRLLAHAPNYVRLFWRLWNDPRVPLYRKAVPILFAMACMGVGMAYFAAKLDLIPDVIPFIGKFDDLLLFLVVLFAPGMWLLIRMSPPEVVMEHVREIDKGRKGDRG